jgi:hypothetical protein
LCLLRARQALAQRGGDRTKPDFRKQLHCYDIIKLYALEDEVIDITGYRNRAHINEKVSRKRVVMIGTKLLLWDTQFCKEPTLKNLGYADPASQKILIEEMMDWLDEDWFAEKGPWLEEEETIPGMLTRVDFYPIRGLLEDIRQRVSPGATRRG